MSRKKEYYQNSLQHLENTQKEYAGDLFHIELAVYEIEKLLQKMQKIDEYNNPILDKLKLDLGQLRKKHEILTHELNDLELDISHVKFMIDILSRDKDDE